MAWSSISVELVKYELIVLPIAVERSGKFIGTAFADSLDKELFSMLVGGGAGVDFRDGMPHQIVIMPNLLSLFAGVREAAKEIASLADGLQLDGGAKRAPWYGVFE